MCASVTVYEPLHSKTKSSDGSEMNIGVRGFRKSLYDTVSRDGEARGKRMFQKNIYQHHLTLCTRISCPKYRQDMDTMIRLAWDMASA